MAKKQAPKKAAAPKAAKSAAPVAGAKAEAAAKVDEQPKPAKAETRLSPGTRVDYLLSDEDRVTWDTPLKEGAEPTPVEATILADHGKDIGYVVRVHGKTGKFDKTLQPSKTPTPGGFVVVKG